MRKMVRIAVALLVLLAVPDRESRTDEAKDAGVLTAFDLIYTKSGDQDLKLDLVRPAGNGPFPAVLVIHGGGWAHGNKSDVRAALNEFANRGFVAVSPQYRFSPGATFPAQIHDVKAAVRWIKTHAREYKVDADHIGAIGFSAGGHLALMLGLTGPEDGIEGDAPQDAPNSRIQAVVNYFGPADLTADDLPTFSQNLIKDFLGGSPQEKPEAAAKASPVTHASKGDAPVLTFQGTNDPLVPHSQAVKLAEALTKAGVPGRVELLLGAGHGWQGDELKRSLEGTFAFFDKYLK